MTSNDVPPTSVDLFAKTVLSELACHHSFTSSESDLPIRNRDQSMRLTCMLQNGERAVGIKLLRQPPSWTAMTTEWVGWARYLRDENNARLVLVVALDPKIRLTSSSTPPYDSRRAVTLLRLLLERAEIPSVVDAALDLHSFWFIDKKRVITVGF